MEKILYRNNLKEVGKRGEFSFLFAITIVVFVFGINFPLHAYASETSELKLDLNPINQINNITLPVNDLINNAIKGLKFDQVINIGTGIPLSPIKSPSQNIDLNKFFSSSKVSSTDIMSFLKEAAITGINLSILIMTITSQVLKGLLSVLK